MGYQKIHSGGKQIGSLRAINRFGHPAFAAYGRIGQGFEQIGIVSSVPEGQAVVRSWWERNSDDQ